MLSWFARISTRQFDIAVQEFQDALAYAIHEFPFTVRNNIVTQSRFGREREQRDNKISFASSSTEE